MITETDIWPLCHCQKLLTANIKVQQNNFTRPMPV